MHQAINQFKSYGHFTKGVDFAYWWSFIGKDLRLQPAQQACLLNVQKDQSPLMTYFNCLPFSSKNIHYSPKNVFFG